MRFLRSRVLLVLSYACLNVGCGARTNEGDSPQSNGGNTAGTGGSSNAGNFGLPALHVEANHIKDPNGNTVVLRGVSTKDIGAIYAWESGIDGIRSRIDTILQLFPHTTVIRLPAFPRKMSDADSAYYSPVPFPVGTAAPTGATDYAITNLTASEYIEQVLRPTVDYAASKHVYAIIDYHQILDVWDATQRRATSDAADAVTFWTAVAPAFANYSNVLFEPFNEPMDAYIDVADFANVAQSWVTAIRASAPNNIIIVSSPEWCQLPAEVSAQSLSGSNLAFTAHIYPENYQLGVETQVTVAQQRVPVFVTEWGYQLSDQSQFGYATPNWPTVFRPYLDNIGASWTAWDADSEWGPTLYSGNNATLSDSGHFVATWLSDAANAGTN